MTQDFKEVQELTRLHQGYHAPDSLLQELIQIVNKTADAQIGVTLLVGGILVSGRLIGGAKYFEEYGDLIARGFGMDGDALAETKERFAERGRSTYPVDPTDDADGNADLPGKIHLKNALFFNQRGEPIVSQETLWRGRVSSVDGYFIGSLSTSKS